jgi:hypothetical protein
MPDHKSKRNAHDRSRIPGAEDREVEYFARQHGITPEPVHELIKERGTGRAKLAAAKAVGGRL